MAWPRGGCPKQGHSAGVASRLPRDPAFDGRPRPCQLSAATALSAVRLARQPVPARSGLNGRGCRSHTAARCLSAGLAWPWSDSRAAVSEARPGSRSAYEAHPYALASEDAGERRERCLAPRQSAPLGVPSPESGRSPATATLAEQGGHAPVPTPPEPLLGSLCGRCGDDQLGPAPSGQARPRAPERSITRPHPSPCSRPEHPQHEASKAEPSLGAHPAGRPGTGVMWSSFRQTCCAARILRSNST